MTSEVSEILGVGLKSDKQDGPYQSTSIHPHFKFDTHQYGFLV